MKKAITLFSVLAFVLCTLLACSNNTYEDGYEDGYADGYSDAEFEMQDLTEEEFFDGYDIGYDDGYREGSDDGWVDNIDEIGWIFEEEAVHYAKDHGGWHPEEAWMIIEAYQNNESFYEDGSSPSEQDYLDAIDSLIYFYDYFYSARY